MRPLKFRIWDGNNRHFVYPEILELNAGLEYQQFTGLLDKQGKEIYEGDIVHWTYSRRLVRGEVAWGTCGFWIKGWVDILEAQYHWPCEVIGNIYESKSLLEKADQ